tara:strand:- start:126 stop:464 length:339 start_codon:yes stop_codon:yes gene_type:complete
MSFTTTMPFFFYKNFTMNKNLNKICADYDISDGKIKVYDYSTDKTRICFSENPDKNKIFLHGKIVKFPFTILEVIKKISEINTCKLNKDKYIISDVKAIICDEKEIMCKIIY